MDELPLGETAVLERIILISGLGEIARRELAFVSDDEAALAKRLGVHLERRRVHRNQHVRSIARGFDRRRTEIDLERRHPEGRALGSADLRREVGEGGQIVSGKRRRQGKLAARQLHAVTAVARKSDDDRFLGRTRSGLVLRYFMSGRSHDRPSNVCFETHLGL